MKTSIGDQTLKYFIMILLKGPDNPYISSNSMIHINSKNMDELSPFHSGAEHKCNKQGYPNPKMWGRE